MRPVFTVLFKTITFSIPTRCWLVYIKCNNCCQLLNSGSTTPYTIYHISELKGSCVAGYFVNVHTWVC
jgi:hypothetical protein